MSLNHKFLYILLTIFFVLIIASFVLGWIYKGGSAVDLVGMLSSVVVAILTVYTLIDNHRQLNITKAQLKEMERNTDFSAQPLPVVSIERIYFEKPRVFYSPPEDEYSGASRLFVKFSIQNYGAQPATNIIVSGFIMIPDGNSSKFFKTASIQIDILGITKDEKNIISARQGVFMFVPSDDFSLISSLRQMEFENTPSLIVTVLYKNILTGSFFEGWQYKLYLRSEQDESTLKNWHSKMVSFHIDYSSEIKALRKLKKSNEDAWDSEFDKLKNTFSISTEQREIELSFSLIPNSYVIKTISKDEYLNRVSKVYFESYIPNWLDECVVLTNRKND